jgi:nicotinamide-nucleotide amidase
MNTYSDRDLERQAEAIGQVLLASDRSIATAESCTGGWIGQCLTGVNGASAWYEGGFVVYSNRAKIELLGVNKALIAMHGAVSSEAAQAMAQGALARVQADYVVAVTGISGPGGGQPNKPVGSVFFCWKPRESDEISGHQVFAGDRESVRRQTVAFALSGLIRLLKADA